MELDSQEAENCEHRPEGDKSVGPKSIDEIFLLNEAGPGSGNGVDRMKLSSPNAVWRNPEGQAAAAKNLGSIPGSINDGSNKWNCPSEWWSP